MSEITIAQPLAGTEVIKRILHKVESMLKQDCYLNGYAAYESVEATSKVDIKMLDVGRMPEVHIEATERSENDLDPTRENFAIEHAEETIGAAPPNQVRLDSEQPIPTLVEHGDGSKEVRGVKYQRKEAVQRSEHEI